MSAHLGRERRPDGDAALGAARRSVFVLFFVFGATLATWVSRLPTIEHNAHLDSAQLGLALLGQPIGQVTATMLMPRVMVRFSSASTARLAAICAALTMVVLGAVSSLIALIGGLLAYGVALGALDIAMNTQAVAVQRAYRRTIMSGVHGVYNIGVLAGSLAGALAAGAGLSPLLQFAIVACLLIGITHAGTLRLLGSEADEVTLAEEYPRDARQTQRLRAHPGLLAIGGIAFCSFFAEGAVDNWSAVFLHQVRHASLAVAPFGTAACGIGMMVGRFSGDAVIARHGPLRTLVGGSLLSAAAMTFALTSAGVAAAVFGYAIFGLGVATVVPIAITLGGSVEGVPPAWALSRISMMGYGAQTTSPALIGLIAHEIKLTWALGTTVVLLLAIGPLTRFVRGRVTHDGR